MRCEPSKVVASVVSRCGADGEMSHVVRDVGACGCALAVALGVGASPALAGTVGLPGVTVAARAGARAVRAGEALCALDDRRTGDGRAPPPNTSER